MRFTLDQYLGTEGFVDCFHCTSSDGRQWRARWTGWSTRSERQAGPRLLDAANFLRDHSHPLLPIPFGVIERDDGVGVVFPQFHGVRLADICPLDQDAAFVVIAELAGLLSFLNSQHTAGRGGSRQVALRSLSAETVWLGGDGDLQLSGLESLTGYWPSRVVHTAYLREGLVPQDKGIDDDVFDLGLLLYELLAGRTKAGHLRTQLEGCDAGKHHRLLDAALDGRSQNARHILSRCLAYYPDERLKATGLAQALFDQLPDAAALTELAATLHPARPERRPHPLIGSVWELGPPAPPSAPLAHVPQAPAQAPPRRRSLNLGPNTRKSQPPTRWVATRTAELPAPPTPMEAPEREDVSHENSSSRVRWVIGGLGCVVMMVLGTGVAMMLIAAGALLVG